MALVIGWLTVIAQVRSERRAAEIAAINRSQDRATLLEQHVTKTLQVAALVTLHLGQTYLLGQSSSGPAQQSEILDDPAIAIAGVAGAMVVDANGRIIARSADAVLPHTWEMGHPSTQEDASSVSLVVSDPRRLEPSGAKFIFVSRTVWRKGRSVGAVVLWFKPEQFLNFPLRTRFDKTDLVSVIKVDGISLARREGDRFSSGEDLRSGLVMRKQREDPNGTYLGPSSLDGVVRYFSHRRLTDFPIFVTAGVSHAAAVSSANRDAIGYFTLMTTMSVFGFFMAWAVRRDSAFRKRKSVELADSTRRLQEAQRIGKIGDWEYDLATGVVIWSDQLCEMYERSPSNDVLSLDEFKAYLAPEGREKFEQDVDLLLTEGGTHSYEFKVILPSGAPSYRRSNAVSVVDEKGKISRLYGTDQDVTSTRVIQELEKQVAHLDRQGAMSMMAGTLAHELNQPLAAAANYVAGSLRSIQRGEDKQSEAVSWGMEEALRQIHNAADIIRRVRRMTQMESDTSRAASVRTAVTDAIALLAATGFEAANGIVVEIAPGLPDASITPVQLQQILINLVKNALEAISAEGGIVLLTVQLPAENWIRFEVRDNGQGFQADTSDVFQSFISHKKSGLGLGLSISRTIAEYHGGKLFVETSRPGNTTMVLELPAVRGGDNSASQAE